jgi:hypothetical protein
MTSLLTRYVGNELGLDLDLQCTPSQTHDSMTTWNITLTAAPRHNDGRATGLFMLAQATAHTIDLAAHGKLEAWRSLSAHSAHMAELATITLPMWGNHPLLIAGDTVEIHADYRSMGIGPLLTADVLPRLGGADFVSVLLGAPLDSEPLTLDEWSAASVSIGGAWACAGFQPIIGGYQYLTSDMLSIEGSGENFRKRSACERAVAA